MAGTVLGPLWVGFHKLCSLLCFEGWVPVSGSKAALPLTTCQFSSKLLFGADLQLLNVKQTSFHTMDFIIQKWSRGKKNKKIKLEMLPGEFTPGFFKWIKYLWTPENVLTLAEPSIQACLLFIEVYFHTGSWWVYIFNWTTFIQVENLAQWFYCNRRQEMFILKCSVKSVCPSIQSVAISRQKSSKCLIKEITES